MKRFLALAFLTLFLVSPANARRIVVKVEKLQNFDITFMSVRGGAITGLPKGREPQKFDINVTLPDGKCTVSLRFVFGNNTRTEVPINFCSPDPVNAESDAPPRAARQCSRRVRRHPEQGKHQQSRHAVRPKMRKSRLRPRFRPTAQIQG